MPRKSVRMYRIRMFTTAKISPAIANFVNWVFVMVLYWLDV